MNINDYAFGIDISKWQGNINFNTVAAHIPKVTFIAAKASEGMTYKDPRFDYNWQEMKRISVGRIAYHYMRFDYPAQAQMDNLLAATKDWNWEHDRLALDCEEEGAKTANEITGIVNSCAEILKGVTGRYPIIYSRAEWVNRKMIVSWMPKYDWWLAHYLKALPDPLYTPEKMPPPALPKGVSTWLIHQTGSRGKSIGAESRYMDYDRWNGTEADVRKYFGMDAVQEPSLEEKVQILWDAHKELW